MQICNGDKCPNCGENALPKVHKEEKTVTARRCQECGYVEELAQVND